MWSFVASPDIVSPIAITRPPTKKADIIEIITTANTVRIVSELFVIFNEFLGINCLKLHTLFFLKKTVGYFFFHKTIYWEVVSMYISIDPEVDTFNESPRPNFLIDNLLSNFSFTISDIP